MASHIQNSKPASVKKKVTFQISSPSKATTEIVTIKRVRWTEEQKKLVLSAYGNYPQGRFPPLNEISEFIMKNKKVLANKDAAKIKAWLSNERKKQSKNLI